MSTVIEVQSLRKTYGTTTGLDPQARHAIWDLVRDVRSKGKTIVLTTHFMEEAEKLR